MTVKDQFKKIKDNWLLILIPVVLLLILGFGTMLIGGIAGTTSYQSFSKGLAMEMDYAGGGIARTNNMYYDNGGFAPEVTERKITKTARVTNEVKRGTFYESESKLKEIVSNVGGFVLNENVNTREISDYEYRTGYYSIKVETTKYNDVLEQIRSIGEVKSFSESADDITEQYTDIEIELAAEKDRLERFKQLLKEATDAEDKVEITDRIFNLERTIKYYEERLENMDNRVDYSTISVTMNEEVSEFAYISIASFSDLVESLVTSFNSVLYLLFVLIPYTVLLAIIVLIVKIARRR